MIRYIIAVLLLTSICTSVVYAESIPVRLKGEEITISKEKIIASGNLEIEYKDIKLKANYMELDAQTWILVATGDITVTQEKNTLRGDKLTLLLKEDVYSLDNVRGEITDRSVKGFIYVKGNTLQRQTDGGISGKEMSFTTCDLSDPHYYIKASELFIYPQERLFARNVSFYIGGSRILTLSYYNLLFDYPDRQPVIPEIGNSTEKGYYMKTFYSHYQSKDLYGYATVEMSEKLGLGLGLTEYYNIKNLGQGFANIYVLPTSETIKSALNIMQEAKLGDVKISGFLDTSNITTNRLTYRLSTSYKGYSISTQGSTNELYKTSSYNTILSASDKIGDINTSLLIRDQYYEREGNPEKMDEYKITANTNIQNVNTSLLVRGRYYEREDKSGKIDEYRITANTKMQDINIRAEVFTLSYPTIDSLPIFGYTHILTKLPELTLSSKLFSSQDLSINGEILFGNYLEIPTYIQGLVLKGNLNISPKSIKLFEGNLDSSIALNGSYYPPENYITGIGANLKWSKEIIKNLSLNLNYEYKNGAGNSQFNILSELPPLPVNSISGSLVSKGDNYSVNVSSRFDLLSYTFSPITINSSWQRDEETKLSLNLSINPYYLADITAVSSISWRIDPKWKIETKWRLSLSVLQFQEIKITYDLHCWEMNVRYNNVTQTTAISFSLKALPSMGAISIPEF